MIVPEGKVQYRLAAENSMEDHVHVTIAHGTARQVQAYKVDNLLCRLVADDKDLALMTHGSRNPLHTYRTPNILTPTGNSHLATLRHRDRFKDYSQVSKLY